MEFVLQVLKLLTALVSLAAAVRALPEVRSRRRETAKGRKRMCKRP